MIKFSDYQIESITLYLGFKFCYKLLLQIHSNQFYFLFKFIIIFTFLKTNQTFHISLSLTLQQTKYQQNLFTNKQKIITLLRKVPYLQQQNLLHMASLETIFKSFDIDNNGYIEFKQLKQVAKKLGQTLSDKQLQELMFGIDKNQDGKISFPEFKQWWLKGHKGKLNQLVFLKARSLKMYNFVETQFKQSGISLQNYKHSDKVDKINVTVSYGEQQTLPNKFTSLQINYFQQGPIVQQKLQKLQIINSNLDKENFNITICLKTKQPKPLIKQLKQMLKSFSDTIQTLTQIVIDDIEKNDYVCVKVFQDQKEKQVIVHIQPGEMVKHFLQQMWKPKQTIVAQLGDEFVFNFGVKAKLNFTLANLFKGDPQTLLQTLMRGFLFNLNIQITESAFKKIKQFSVKNFDQGKELLPLFLLKRFGLTIKLRSPQNIKKFFSKLGVQDILSTSVPNLQQLLESVAPQIQHMKKSVDAGNTQEAIPFFQNIYGFVKLVAKRFDSGTQIYVSKKDSLFELKIQGNGIEDVYKTLFIQSTIIQ